MRRVREIYGRGRAGRMTRRIAFVHDWLTGMRGGEKVLDALCERFPQAEVFTLRSRTRIGVAHNRTGPPAHLVRAAPAVRQAALPDVPAAFSGSRRAIRLRRLRPHRQHQPLLREVRCPAGPGPAPLLLPDADALRVGSVRCVLRARIASERPRNFGDAAAPWPGWRAGTATPPAVPTAMSLFLIMLRAGSADTIIARRLWSIRPSTPTISPPQR